MFVQPIFYNLKFTITQAVNPHIQQPANKFVEKAVTLPSKKVKNSGVNSAKKILGKDIAIHAQPKTDMVVLSAKPKTQKAQHNANNGYGKTIKNVLNKYFDNSETKAEAYKNAKQNNLTNLVKTYEKENLERQRKNSYTNETLEEERQKAMRQMKDRAIEVLGFYKEGAREGKKEMARNIKKNYPGYVPSHEEIVENTSKIYQ